MFYFGLKSVQINLHLKKIIKNFNTILQIRKELKLTQMDRVQWLAVNLSDVTVLALRVSMFLIRHDSLPKSSLQRRITKLLCQLYAHTRACHDDSRALW